MIGTPEELSKYLWNLDKDKKYSIKEHKEKRSIRANNYAWELIGKIGIELKRNKNEIYREFIRNRGIYRIITLSNNSVPTFIKLWNDRGLGWLCETSETEIEGFTDVIAYYGSSSYSTKQMAYFIDYVIQEAKLLGIETLPPDEIEKMKKDWRQL